jgi:glucuronoarabinoxylan endo-1,4-beta-xylanase
VLAPKIHALGAKVIAAEQCCGGDYIDPIKGDGTANGSVDIFSWHQYSGQYSSGDTTRHGWETEMSSFNEAFDPSLNNALNEVTHWIWNVIVNGSMHAWHYWEAVTPYNYGNPPTVNNLGLLGDGNGSYAASDVNPTKRYYVVGNFSRFARPGWVRVNVSGSLSGIYGVTAFKNPTTGAFAIIAINDSGGDIQNISFSLSGANISGSVTPYVTSGTALDSLGTDGNLSAGSASSNVPSSISVNGNAFTSTVPYGVTTFVGQTR